MSDFELLEREFDTSPPQDQVQEEEIAAAIAILAGLLRGRVPRKATSKRWAINRLSYSTSLKMRGYGVQLLNVTITLNEWYLLMQEAIKTSHIASGLIWSESVEALTLPQRAQIIRETRNELRLLERFRRQIIDELPQAKGGRIASRSAQYGGAVRGTYHSTARVDIAQNNYTLERNILNPADHCEGLGSCPGETAKGWQPVGSLIPIGSRACNSGCKCDMQYQNPQTGDIVTV